MTDTPTLIPPYAFPGPEPAINPLSENEAAVIKAELSLTLALNAEQTGHAKGISEADAETLIGWVAGYTREKLARQFGGAEKFKLAHSVLGGMCVKAQGITAYALEKLGLAPVQQHTYALFSSDRLSHAFTLVTIPVLKPDQSVEDKPYLIDTTYRQFFDPKIPKLPTQPDVYNAGFVITRTPEGAEVADTLLKQGYIALNEQNAALYLGSLANGNLPRRPSLELMMDKSTSRARILPADLHKQSITASSPLRRLQEERLAPAPVGKSPV